TMEASTPVAAWIAVALTAFPCTTNSRRISPLPDEFILLAAQPEEKPVRVLRTLPLSPAVAPQAARANLCASQTALRAAISSSIISSEWAGDGVRRRRSVPLGTVG